MILSSDKDEAQFQTNVRDMEKPQAQTSRAKGQVVEKSRKRLAWALAIFTFAVSVPVFVEYYPVWEPVFCMFLAATVFGFVRIGLQMVKGFYERLPHDHY